MSLISQWLLDHWPDLAVLAVFGYYMYGGVRRGFIRVGLEVFGFFLGILAALTLNTRVGLWIAANLDIALPFAKVIAFFAIWTSIEAVFPSIANRLYVRVPERLRQSRWNRLAGALPALFDGVLTASMIASMVVALPMPLELKRMVLDAPLSGGLVRATDVLGRAVDDVFGGAVRQTLDFMTVKQETNQRVDLGFKTQNFRPDETAEAGMLALVNKERTMRGLKPLRLDKTILSAARAHAADMLTRGYFAHVTPEGLSPSDRADKAGIKYIAYGENLAFAPDLALAHQGLMNSPGHRANILNPVFDRVGIAVLDAGVYGMVFVQNFAR